MGYQEKKAFWLITQISSSSFHSTVEYKWEAAFIKVVSQQSCYHILPMILLMSLYHPAWRWWWVKKSQDEEFYCCSNIIVFLLCVGSRRSCKIWRTFSLAHTTTLSAKIIIWRKSYVFFELPLLFWIKMIRSTTETHNSTQCVRFLFLVTGQV